MIHIYGREIDGRLVSNLKKLENVCIMGEKKEIPYSSYKGLINTSKIENLSISVCEAIKYQTPVFCFRVGGLPEVVENNRTGFVFDCFDIEKMTDAISKYQSSEQLNIPKDVLADFSWDVAAQNYIDYMNQ